MKQKYFSKILIICFLFLGIYSSWGQIYNADFSNDGDGFPDHTKALPPAIAPQTTTVFGTAPNSWVLSYTKAPSTDTKDNIFKVRSGKLETTDWGGEASFKSTAIDISNINTINISALGETLDNDVQNISSEFFNFFYILDGNTSVKTDIPLTGDTSETPVNYTISNLDVSNANSIIVGFTFKANGGKDGYSISEFKVENTVLSTKAFNKEFSANVYPNPVKDGKLFIETNNSDTNNILIYNVLGRKVLSQKATSIDEIDVSNLKSGIYVLTITSNNKSLTKKIVIQ